MRVDNHSHRASCVFLQGFLLHFRNANHNNVPAETVRKVVNLAGSAAGEPGTKGAGLGGVGGGAWQPEEQGAT